QVEIEAQDMPELGHDGLPNLRRWRWTRDRDQPVPRAGLADGQRASADPGERHRDFEAPSLLIEAHGRQLGDPVREEDTPQVDDFARGAYKRKFGGPAPTLPSPASGGGCRYLSLTHSLRRENPGPPGSPRSRGPRSRPLRPRP